MHRTPAFCTAPSTRAGQQPALQASGGRLQFADRMPRYVSLEDTPSGLMMVSSPKRADGRLQYSAGPWMMPIFCTPGSPAPHLLQHMRIPIDDESLMFYRCAGAMSQFPRRNFLLQARRVCLSQAGSGTFTPADNKSTITISTGSSSGAFPIPASRPSHCRIIAMMEDQRGPLMDRTREHLASSDAAIIQVRRRLLGAARALAEGKEPEAPWHPEAYAYHSARL